MDIPRRSAFNFLNFPYDVSCCCFPCHASCSEDFIVLLAPNIVPACKQYQAPRLDIWVKISGTSGGRAHTWGGFIFWHFFIKHLRGIRFFFIFRQKLKDFTGSIVFGGGGFMYGWASHDSVSPLIIIFFWLLENLCPYACTFALSRTHACICPTRNQPALCLSCLPYYCKCIL